MLKKYFIILILSLNILCNVYQEPKACPEILEECECWDDTIYVVNYWYFNESGKKKPPCSMSLEYDACIKSRLKALNIE
jgi:hypothetical protein